MQSTDFGAIVSPVITATDKAKPPPREEAPKVEKPAPPKPFRW